MAEVVEMSVSGNQSLTRAEEVLAFWFATPGISDSPERRQKIWFGGSDATDQMIRERFETDVKKAVVGEYDDWAQSARGSLALIILLDQFSLNIHRDEARSYLQSAMALPVALKAIRRGFDQFVPIEWRLFFYLPLEHSEDVRVQRQSVRLFEQLAAYGRELGQSVGHGDDAGLPARLDAYLDYAKRHAEVVEQFGRMPYWNELLGRESAPEEATWLASGGPDF